VFFAKKVLLSKRLRLVENQKRLVVAINFLIVFLIVFGVNVAVN
jgi:hypothetical protein